MECLAFCRVGSGDALWPFRMLGSRQVVSSRYSATSGRRVMRARLVFWRSGASGMGVRMRLTRHRHFLVLTKQARTCQASFLSSTVAAPHIWMLLMLRASTGRGRRTLRILTWHASDCIVDSSPSTTLLRLSTLCRFCLVFTGLNAEGDVAPPASKQNQRQPVDESVCRVLLSRNWRQRKSGPELENPPTLHKTQ